MIKYKVVLIYSWKFRPFQIIKLISVLEMDDDYKVIENLGNNEYLKEF
jgi:hypothetical protein